MTLADFLKTPKTKRPIWHLADIDAGDEHVCF
jgi:hypothetical protein